MFILEQIDAMHRGEFEEDRSLMVSMFCTIYYFSLKNRELV